MTGDLFSESVNLCTLAESYRMRGEYARAAQCLRQGLALAAEAADAADVLYELIARSRLALVLADAGQAQEARPQIERCREILGAGEDWRGLAGHVARAEAALAAADGRFYDANAQFEKAIANFKRYTLPHEEADTFLHWGRAANAAGDSRASEKFDAAIELYRHHGFAQRLIERVEADRQAGPRRSMPISDKGTADAVFRREGEFWTIVWRGKTSRLKDAKGLHYIAYLLVHPGDQIHVHDLITIVEGSAVDTQSHAAANSDGLEIVRDIGSRDAALDSRARSEYGARLRELRTELDEAERFNDTGRSERLRAEIDLVSDELTAGLGRRASSDSAERARGMVSKRIRATLDKIHDEDPALGRHFATSIKTGYFCAYFPDPDHKIVWQI
jgi:non-specific serine/threonine protein kinase